MNLTLPVYWFNSLACSLVDRVCRCRYSSSHTLTGTTILFSWLYRLKCQFKNRIHRAPLVWQAFVSVPWRLIRKMWRTVVLFISCLWCRDDCYTFTSTCDISRLFIFKSVHSRGNKPELHVSTYSPRDTPAHTLTDWLPLSDDGSSRRLLKVTYLTL